MATSRENGLPVPDDIIDKILLASPSFSSLKATRLTCKQFNRVFQSHPNSVVRAVAYNITGPALPQALECIRHPLIPIHTREPPYRAYRSVTEEYGDLSSAPITPLETHEIMLNSNIVSWLEDLFSFRYIDRTTFTSQLSSSESRAFCVSVYRLMLYSAIADLNAWMEVFSFEHRDHEGLEHRNNIEKGRRTFSCLSTRELLQLHSIAEFLREILSFCALKHGYPDDICDLAVVAGPAQILKYFYNEADIQTLDDISYYFEGEPEFLASVSSSPHIKILESRNIEPPPDFAHWHSISSRVTDVKIRLGSVLTAEVVSSHFLTPKPNFISNFALSLAFLEISNGNPCYRIDMASQRNYGPQRIRQYLKGRLQYNSTEVVPFIEKAGKLGSSLLLQIWDDLWRLNLVQQQSQAQPLPQALPDWTEDSYLCNLCFTNFLIENLWIWWRHIKSSSQSLKEDCCHGFTCEMQMSSVAHTEEFNHLCEKTPEDTM
ncbi:hypothetical protein EV360DRAFT_80158 [Lentinula raphanica]|nr:hypothetical protein EV360DRAFT_80158 [Lentinula raphanica]